MVYRHANRHPAVVVTNGYPLQDFSDLRVGKPYTFLVALAYGDLTDNPRAKTLLACIEQQLRGLGDGVLAASELGDLGNVTRECHETRCCVRLEAECAVFRMRVTAVAEVTQDECTNASTGRADLGVGANDQSLDSRIDNTVGDAVVEVQGGHRLPGHHGEADARHSALLRSGQGLIKGHQQRQLIGGTLADLLTANAGHPSALSAGLGVVRHLEVFLPGFRVWFELPYQPLFQFPQGGRRLQTL
ncbi:hypothetical protein D3C72_1202240 [compost metagenome]